MNDRAHQGKGIVPTIKADGCKGTVSPKETVGLKRFCSRPRTLHQQEADGYARTGKWEDVGKSIAQALIWGVGYEIWQYMLELTKKWKVGFFLENGLRYHFHMLVTNQIGSQKKQNR